MALSDYAKALLAGGLPQVLDLGPAAGNAQGDTRPEYTAPVGTHVDRDTATAGRSSPIVSLDGKTIAIGVGAVLLVGAIMFVSLKALR
jgi:hypothetical protein